MVGIQAKFRLDSVESIVYADESSKNDRISEINNSIEPLDGMNDLLVTKGVTLDNSNKLSKTREDVNKSSSYIKKYLAHKLSLQSEDEVEIHMLGRPIHPTFPLKHLAELWLRVASNSGKYLAKVGAFAQELAKV
ncbi:hypothetical protein MTR67_025885 [Solanum verrucosum]|uniref:Uncharacterized protein n=1 Tax=Solanum verrucosum TaxID=315347 RepID=A0AAF0TYZ8_SOLVR|nr:hypothetical protein MTR67_025885 [Solanum verrucosum]